MTRKTLFPEIPEQPVLITQIEEDEIASHLVSIWENPPEVVSHALKDGKIVPEGTDGSTPVMTKSAHYDMSFRLREAINRSSFTAERKAEIGRIKHMLKTVDEDLFREADEIAAKVDEAMRSATPPKDKVELEGMIPENRIPISTFTKRYMDAKVEKVDATFKEFENKYKEKSAGVLEELEEPKVIE